MITVMAMATSTRRGAVEPSDPASRIKRVLLLLALGVAAFLMLRQSLAEAVRPVDPALALRLDSDNADVAASRAEQLLRLDPSNRAEVERLARRALRRSPVSAAGARMLATARDVAGDSRRARALMVYSESLSRRDWPTQVWLIQDAVAHDDIPLVLHHYDIALRTSDATKAFLLPVLVKAIGQPPVVNALIDTLAARPQWAAPFLEVASRDAQDLDGLARLLQGLAGRGYPIATGVVTQASARMVDAGRYESAWLVYAASHGHPARAIVRDPNFAHIELYGAGPFEWTIVTGNGLTALSSRYGARDALTYSAATGAGGVIARQLLLLPPGAARLAGRSYEGAADGSSAQLRLTCAGSGQPIMTRAANQAIYIQDFAVPADCSAQWLEVVVDGGDSPLGASGAIGDLQILPGNRGRRT
jgi:hypothetical protein